MWPVQLTAGLVGISLLGAQAPLATFAGTDPVNGYGLGLDASSISYIIGAYLVSMIIGALLFPRLSKWTSPRIALIVATFFVATGYLLFLPFHQTVPTTFMNMAIAGIGSGALVGALPAAAAAAAPRGPDRHRDRPHEHDEDDRRLVRVGDLRDRAVPRRGPGGHGHRIQPGQLPDRVHDLRRRRAGRGRAAVPGARSWRSPTRRCSRRTMPEPVLRLQLAPDQLVRGGLGDRADGDEVQVDVGRQLDRLGDGRARHPRPRAGPARSRRPSPCARRRRRSA